MPSRRLPNSVPSLSRCLSTCKDTYDRTAGPDRAIGGDLYAQLNGAPNGLLPRMVTARRELDAALATHGPLTDSLAAKADRAAMFIAHFHRVLDMAIIRGAMAAGARGFYGRDIHATSIPDLTTYQAIHEAGQNIIAGEPARQTAEGSQYVAMQNPSAAEVGAVVSAFEAARAASAAAQAITNTKQEVLQALYAQALPVATDVYDTVEFFYRKDPDASSRREKCARWGVVYVYGEGETPPVPEPAETSNITTPGPGQVHFHYDAVNASTFDVLHKAPLATEFAKVADNVEAKVYQGSGLAVGAHEYKVIGRNVTGDGPASDIAVVQIN